MLQSWWRQRWPLSAVFLAVYALLFLYVMAQYDAASNHGDPWPHSTLERMVDGTAMKPFCFRLLVPQLVGLVSDLVPVWLQNQLHALFHGIAPMRDADGVQPFFRRDVMFGVVGAFLLGYMAMLYRLGSWFFPHREAMALFMPIVGLAMLPGFMFTRAYIYDFATLCLSAACFYCMARGWFGRYLLCFALACLNRESAIYLTLFFALWFVNRLELKRFSALLVAQGLFYGFVKVWLAIIYAGNTGKMLFSYFDMQMGMLLSSYDYSRLVELFALWFLLSYRWQEKPLFARYALWMLPPMYIGYLCFAFPREWRTLFDVFPMLTLLITHTLVEGTGIAASPIFSRERR